jgi:hypothetical protein
MPEWSLIEDEFLVSLLVLSISERLPITRPTRMFPK